MYGPHSAWGSPSAVRAADAWGRLEHALRAYSRGLERTRGVTAVQLAMLRLVAETGPVRLAELRERLGMHPATLGQLVDRLAARRLVSLERDPRDGRRRVVTVTSHGRALLADAPVAGPVRLRSPELPRERLDRLAEAFEDAIELFGVTRWS